jgi:hypothetical protein
MIKDGTGQPSLHGDHVWYRDLSQAGVIAIFAGGPDWRQGSHLNSRNSYTQAQIGCVYGFAVTVVTTPSRVTFRIVPRLESQT